jgi:hypothetical protein
LVGTARECDVEARAACTTIGRLEWVIQSLLELWQSVPSGRY